MSGHRRKLATDDEVFDDRLIINLVNTIYIISYLV